MAEVASKPMDISKQFAEHQGELRTIDVKLSAINNTLNKVVEKLDSLQSEINMIHFKVMEIDTWKKASSVETKLDMVTDHNSQLAVLEEKLNGYDSLKKDVAELQKDKAKYLGIFTAITFVISLIGSYVIKILTR